MPQVFFNADEFGLVNYASLWIEAEVDDAHAINEHEAALHAAGFSDEGLPPKLPKTQGKQVWGQHLRSDEGKGGHHTWVTMEVANRLEPPNAREPEAGGAVPRYEAKIHLIPKDPSKQPISTSIWSGNDARHFIDGVKNRNRDHMTWPDV